MGSVARLEGLHLVQVIECLEDFITLFSFALVNKKCSLALHSVKTNPLILKSEFKNIDLATVIKTQTFFPKPHNNHH